MQYLGFSKLSVKFKVFSDQYFFLLFAQCVDCAFLDMLQQFSFLLQLILSFSGADRAITAVFRRGIIRACVFGHFTTNSVVLLS